MEQQPRLAAQLDQLPPQLVAQIEEVFAKAAALQKEAWDQGATYSKVLIGLGFAGFLTIWSTTRDLLGPHQKIVVAFLLAFSLFWYVAFEVAQMIYLSHMRLQLAREMARSTSPTRMLDTHNQKIQKHAPTWARLWYGALCLTVIPGFLGGSILLYAFVWRLLH